MIVYLSTSGEYSDYRVCHAFRNREDAGAYPLGDAVKELEVHDGPVEVRTWHYLNWRADHPDKRAGGGFTGNPSSWHEQKDFDGDPRNVMHAWHGPPERTGPILTVQGWDKQAVLKVYSEQRARYLARQEGVS